MWEEILLHCWLTYFFISLFISECLESLIKRDHRRLATSFNLCYQYTDDLIIFNERRFVEYV